MRSATSDALGSFPISRDIGKEPNASLVALLIDVDVLRTVTLSCHLNLKSLLVAATCTFHLSKRVTLPQNTASTFPIDLQNTEQQHGTGQFFEDGFGDTNHSTRVLKLVVLDPKEDRRFA